MKPFGALLAVLVFGGCWGCCTAPQMTEFSAHYDIGSPQNIAEVPMILVGFVLADARPAGALRPSRRDGHQPTRPWMVSVRVENVLQGNVPQKEISLFYFLGTDNLGSSASPLTFATGDRKLFFLERDAGVLRTICDNWDSCVEPVFSGFHPHFKKDSHQPVTEAIVDLLLTRGEGATDNDMIKAVRRVAGFHGYGEQVAIKRLQQVAREETAPVRAAGCYELAFGGHPCASNSGGENPQAKDN